MDDRCHICNLPVQPDERGFLACPVDGQVWQPQPAHNGQGAYYIKIYPLTEEQRERMWQLTLALAVAA